MGVVVASLWFAAIAFGGVDLWARVVLQWLMVLGLVFFALRLAVARRPKLVLPPVFWAATLFMAYAVGRYWYADVEYVARQELIRVAICYLVFAMVTTSLSGQRSVKVLVYAMIFLATLEAAYGIYQWSAKPGTVLGFPQHAQYVARGSGTLFNPNHLAGLIGLVLPVSITLAVMSREPHWLRILVAYCAGVQALGLVATLSRGGILAACIALVLLGAVIVWKMRRRWILLGSGGALILLVVLLVDIPQSVKRRFQELPSERGLSVFGERLLIWRAGWSLVKEQPWFGVGPDHFDIRFRKYRDLWLQTVPRRVHNDYLQLAVDWGVVGVAGVGIFGAGLLWGLKRTWPFLDREETAFDSSPGSTRMACVLGSACGAVFLVIHSVGEFNLFLPGCALVASVCLGIMASSFRYASKAGGVSLGLPGRSLAGSAVAVCIVWVAAGVVTGSREAWWLVSAAKLESKGEDRSDTLRLALRAEPANPWSHFLLGEILRMRSFEGDSDYEALAQDGFRSLSTASKLDPWNPFYAARAAMCLDWLGRHAEAEPLMTRALALDPNNKSIVTLVGWHYLQAGDLKKAREHLDLAHNRIPHARDPLSGILLQRVDEMLAPQNLAPKR